MTRVVLLAALLAGGCADAWPLSGTVTYDGRPLPYGEVVLYPDPAGGVSGPGVSVAVLDGRYETPADRGHRGGKYVARVTGYRPGPGSPVGPSGHAERMNPLFYNWEERFELPRGPAVKEFVIPAQPSPTAPPRK